MKFYIWKQYLRGISQDTDKLLVEVQGGRESELPHSTCRPSQTFASPHICREYSQ